MNALDFGPYIDGVINNGGESFVGFIRPIPKLTAKSTDGKTMIVKKYLQSLME